jgi:hypothetical protein
MMREQGKVIKPHRRQKRLDEFWGVRVDALIRACGWPQKDWRKHFGFSAQTVRRVRYGAPPKLDFVRSLRKLEEAYATELEALAGGLIVTRGRSRYCWIDIPRPAPFVRPPDLRDLGAAGLLDQNRKS